MYIFNKERMKADFIPQILSSIILSLHYTLLKIITIVVYKYKHNIIFYNLYIYILTNLLTLLIYIHIIKSK